MKFDKRQHMKHISSSVVITFLLGETAIDIAKNDNHKQIIALIQAYTESSGILNRLLFE